MWLESMWHKMIYYTAFLINHSILSFGEIVTALFYKDMYMVVSLKDSMTVFFAGTMLLCLKWAGSRLHIKCRTLIIRSRMQILSVIVC